MQCACNTAHDSLLAESEYLFHLARMALAVNHTARAIHLIRQALSISPSNLGYLKGLAELMLKTRRFDEALMILRQTLALEPHQPDILSMMGMAADGLNDEQAASQYYRQADMLRSARNNA